MNLKKTLPNVPNLLYRQEDLCQLSVVNLKSVLSWLAELTLKSHGVRMRSGGIRSGGGGDDWLSKEMPRLSLIWRHKSIHAQDISTLDTPYPGAQAAI